MTKYQLIAVVGLIFLLSVVYKRPNEESTLVQMSEGSVQNINGQMTIRSTVQNSAVQNSAVQNSAVQNSVVQDSAVQKSAVQKSYVQNSALQNNVNMNSPGIKVVEYNSAHQRGVDKNSTDQNSVDHPAMSPIPLYSATNTRQTISSHGLDGHQEQTDEPRKATVGVCSNEQRLHTVEQYCKANNVADHFLYKYRRERKLLELQQQRQQRRRGAAVSSSSSSAANTQQASDWLDELPDEDIRNISKELWVDPANRVLVCLHSKAGTTTWKAILGNNTMSSEFVVDREQSIHADVLARGLRTADSGNNIDEMKFRLRNWYKIAVVRHPFDRLVSSFNDKVLSEDPTVPSAVFSQRLRDTIQSKYQATYRRPSASNSSAEKVLFKDFIQLILDGYKNDHWNGPYEDKCHTCLLQYDYIVKLESEARDAHYIIKQKLRGRGLDTHYNQRRPRDNSFLTQHGRDLSSYFHTLSPQQYQGLQQKYASDFHMFGYHMDDRTFTARCSDQTANVTCC